MDALKEWLRWWFSWFIYDDDPGPACPAPAEHDAVGRLLAHCAEVDRNAALPMPPRWVVSPWLRKAISEALDTRTVPTDTIRRLLAVESVEAVEAVEGAER